MFWMNAWWLLWSEETPQSTMSTNLRYYDARFSSYIHVHVLIYAFLYSHWSTSVVCSRSFKEVNLPLNSCFWSLIFRQLGSLYSMENITLVWADRGKRTGVMFVAFVGKHSQLRVYYDVTWEHTLERNPSPVLFVGGASLRRNTSSRICWFTRKSSRTWWMIATCCIHALIPWFDNCMYMYKLIVSGIQFGHVHVHVYASQCESCASYQWIIYWN